MEVIYFELSIATEKGFELMDLTPRVQDSLVQERAANGLVVIFSPHTTMGITINELEEALANDVQLVLAGLIPKGADYEHNAGESEFNADAHIKNILIGQSVTVPVQDGRLVLGTWQKILAVEMDGARQRTIKVSFLGETE